MVEFYSLIQQHAIPREEVITVFKQVYSGLPDSQAKVQYDLWVQINYSKEDQPHIKAKQQLALVCQTAEGRLQVHDKLFGALPVPGAAGVTPPQRGELADYLRIKRADAVSSEDAKKKVWRMAWAALQLKENASVEDGKAFTRSWAKLTAEGIACG